MFVQQLLSGVSDTASTSDLHYRYLVANVLDQLIFCFFSTMHENELAMS